MNTPTTPQQARPASYTEYLHRQLFSDFQEPPVALTAHRPRR
ncbi:MULTISPECIES: hypothetical protein [Rhodococcus erythropolis group]|nr:MULTISPECIES: hypothetical protein [Rhodococcus erythropolis group]MDJ0434738.1 hypothetical protein [Rhodococcus qingshengii]